MDVLRRDIRSALVAMRRAPGFAATALTTLALGIGATTAVFSIVNGVLLQPLPYVNPDRLVRLWEEYPGGVSPAGNRWLSRGTYAGWIEHTNTLDALGGYSLLERQITFGSDGFKVFGSAITPAVLNTLGASPALGRFLRDDDDRDGGAKVAVLSDRLWREHYSASPNVLGSTLTIDGEAHTIVGVAPASFEFPDPHVRFWVPYGIPRVATGKGSYAFTSLARVKPGVSMAQVEAEGTAIARAAPKGPLTEFFFGKGGPVVVHARPLMDDMTAPMRPAISVLAVAVALVLLIACANVTNLLLSRGVTRQRELAIRAAVGGSRARIVRQLLTESAVFSIVGGALGLLLAYWLVNLLPAIAPSQLPRLEDIRFDASVAKFWALATLMTTLAAGLVPAWRGGRIDLNELTGALRSPDGSTGSGFRGAHARHLRDGLLIVEAAFAVILIVGASLLARSFIRLMQVDNGYTAEGVLIARVELPEGAAPARTDQLIDGALARLRAMPNVSAAGAAAMIPLMRQTAIIGVTIPPALAGNKATQGRALVYWITPGYAEAIGLRLRAGRFFTDADSHVGGGMPTMVNQEFVRQHLSVPNAVGLSIPGLIHAEGNPSADIVGVVGNVLKYGNDQQPEPELYVVHGSYGVRIGNGMNFVIRTRGNPTAIAADVRGLMRQIDRESIVVRTEPLKVDVAASLDTPRFAASVVGGFALVAMILAAIGLYGVLSYSVSQRLRELGIRAALGAGRGNLVGLVVREALAVTVAGVVLGVLGAGVFTRMMQQLLFGVTPLDAMAFGIAPLMLVTAAMAACIGPAWRAATADPVITLRR